MRGVGFAGPALCRRGLELGVRAVACCGAGDDFSMRHECFM